MIKSADISTCGRYRYFLTRTWDAFAGKRAVFIGLNPSTADAEIDDPTVRRCIAFATREGCGSLTMLNLYALRATNPDALWFTDPGERIGDHTDNFIRHHTNGSPLVIACWGAVPKEAQSRVERVLYVLHNRPPMPPPFPAKLPIYCLSVTKAGHPGHPLYLPKTAPLVEWAPRARASEVKL